MEQLIRLRFVIPCLYLLLSVFFFYTYFGSYSELIGHWFFKGFGEALLEAEASGAQQIYVTADAKEEGYGHVSQILTLFYDETDALYFQGKTNINHGEECLPYSERFHYVSFTQELVDSIPAEDVAFVTLDSDAAFFDEEKYSIVYFERYCAVTKR